ncbi:MAG TPA: Asp-tRNA(Asn)/Glu-tRNA(Gln) amidotransferase subunit GatC [Clostridiales bacterium]|jgi:aspartyl-tRNA(Asn)/glutamyl-tRNA(Gln) amidotransferase subunit C|nr:Asp-tRNA(Asn)/Glu-tRNA(Gln) amidotransferase subunit GatC [Clostridiales bacterium]
MRTAKEIVEYVAELSRIKLDEDETEKMIKELGEVIEYMDILQGLDTEGVEPMSHVFPITNVMREDEVTPSFEREDILRNAPERTDETLVVPKTIE